MNCQKDYIYEKILWFSSKKGTLEQFSRILWEIGSKKKFSRLSEKANFTSTLFLDSLKILTAAIFSIFKVFYSVKFADQRRCEKKLYVTSSSSVFAVQFNFNTTCYLHCCVAVFMIRRYIFPSKHKRLFSFHVFLKK